MQYVYNRAYKRVHIHAATANTVFMAWLLACARHSLTVQYEQAGMTCYLTSSSTY